MANTRTLTSTTAILLIGIDGLYSAAVRIQGFSSDDITDADSVEPVETSMGLDGRLSAGFVPVPIRQNITLQADSVSNDIFEAWSNYERNQKEKVVAFGSLILPATKRSYIMQRGFLRTYAPFPAARKSLQPRKFTIEWQSITPVPYLI